MLIIPIWNVMVVQGVHFTVSLFWNVMVVQGVHFTVSLDTAASSHRKSPSAGTSRDSSRGMGHDV